MVESRWLVCVCVCVRAQCSCTATKLSQRRKWSLEMLLLIFYCRVMLLYDIFLCGDWKRLVGIGCCLVSVEASCMQRRYL